MTQRGSPHADMSSELERYASLHRVIVQSTTYRAMLNKTSSSPVIAATLWPTVPTPTRRRTLTRSHTEVGPVCLATIYMVALPVSSAAQFITRLRMADLSRSTALHRQLSLEQHSLMTMTQLRIIQFITHIPKILMTGREAPINRPYRSALQQCFLDSSHMEAQA